ncbi:MAG: N-acetylmuramoyl-L-alanine amidase, partial [Sediminibacterium sp.]|nr:N-acetylmuramoyl-L-alanine amidase [Sediminibacterium sp.]
MTPTLYYFLQVILCSGIMVGYYWLVLRNNRFHQYNRFYLLAIALFSWVVPLIKIQWNKPVATDAQLIQFFSIIADNNSEIESNLNKGWLQYSWQGILMMIYVLVGIVLLVGLIKSLIQIYRLLKTHSCKTVGEVFLILTKAQGAPFSFFRYIFWHESIDLKSDAGKQMMQHELTHVQQKHSIDKIFMQLVLIAGWFNPFFWLIKKEMEMIHEFIADKKAVANGDTTSLAQMLLAAAYPQQQYLLTNPFFFSPIKRRLQMITKNTNPKYSYMRRLVVLPLLAIVVVLFAFRTKELRNAENISVGTIVDNIVDQIAAKTKPAFSPKNILLNKQYTVVINAGHGGSDAGASAFDGKTMEKTLTLELAKAIQYVNQNNQIKIILTRETDLTQTVYEIANYANQQAPDLFISLHCNAADKNLAATKNGMEIYIADKLKNANYAESYLLANQLANNLTGLDIPMNGLKSRKEGIYVLQNVKSPAILLETGFISNTSDLNQLKNEAYQQKLAASILNGIQYYFSSKEKGVTIDTTILNSDSVYVIPNGKEVKIIGSPTFLIPKDNPKYAFIDTYRGTLTYKDPTYQPLILINGVIEDSISLKSINPNIIDHIQVLKNEKAVEIFGEKGRNGVIAITTKKNIVIGHSLSEIKLAQGKKIDFNLEDNETYLKTVNKANAIVLDGIIVSKEVASKLDIRDIMSVGFGDFPIDKVMKHDVLILQTKKEIRNASSLYIENDLRRLDLMDEQLKLKNDSLSHAKKFNKIFNDINGFIYVMDGKKVKPQDIDPKVIGSMNIIDQGIEYEKYAEKPGDKVALIKSKSKQQNPDINANKSIEVNSNNNTDPSGIKAFLNRNPTIKMVSWNHNPLRMNLEFKDGSIETYDLSNASSVEKAMNKYGKLSLPAPP